MSSHQYSLSVKYNLYTTLLFNWFNMLFIISYNKIIFNTNLEQNRGNL